MKPIIYTGEDISSETNLWANAMTKDGSMWVWIPRYAYKITSGYVENKIHESDEYGLQNEDITGTIEIKFIDIENNFLDGTKETITTSPSEIHYKNGVQTEWLVHPAFTSTPANGGWDKELEGIWVGKFEATGNYDAENGSGTLSVKPANQSIRNLSINDSYKFAKSSTFGESISAETLGSHMAKNSEWGAVSYLTCSKYGTNGKPIGRNENDAFYTGGSNSEETVYKTNYTQSTTGNATGIYDMNGGSAEFVAAYVNFRNGSTDSSYKTFFAEHNDGQCYLVSAGGGESTDFYGNSKEIRNTSTKYKTVYAPAGNTNKNSTILTYLNNSLLKGDAIYETSSGTAKTREGETTTNSWFNEQSSYPSYTSPFFRRGGAYNGTGTGLFYYNKDTGAAVNVASFRPVLAF